MNKEIDNSELEQERKREAIFKVLEEDGVNIPDSAGEFKLNTVGLKVNKRHMFNFSAIGIEEKDKKTYHSREVSFQAMLELKKLGVKEGITRE